MPSSLYTILRGTTSALCSAGGVCGVALNTLGVSLGVLWVCGDVWVCARKGLPGWSYVASGKWPVASGE